MSYRTSRRPERRRSNGCLLALVALVWAVLIAVLLYRFLLGQPDEPGANASLPTAIAALPTGEFRVSEAQANEFLSSRAESLKPLDGVSVRFVPGQVQADLLAFGTTSTATFGLAVDKNRIIAVDPRLDGPLGQVVTLPSLTASLEQQLNDQLAIQGRTITTVRIEQGAIVVTADG
jgi:hypothetical protein